MVTRTVIAEALTGCFDHGRADRAALIETARRSEASTDVITALLGLPDQTFTSTRDIWKYLPGIPIDN